MVKKSAQVCINRVVIATRWKSRRTLRRPILRRFQPIGGGKCTQSQGDNVHHYSAFVVHALSCLGTIVLRGQGRQFALGPGSISLWWWLANRKCAKKVHSGARLQATVATSLVSIRGGERRVCGGVRHLVARGGGNRRTVVDAAV